MEQKALNADVFLHDNVSPDIAASTRELLGHFNWELFDHLAYNLQLAPSDYRLFTYLITLLKQ
jgi:hypothetical protein